MTKRSQAFGVFTCFLSLMSEPTWLSAENPADRVTDVVKLANVDVKESSGLAASWRTPEHFWTHNDSGDRPRLYAFNQQGKATGRVELKGCKASDWEDMASFVDRGVPRILVADCGDNDRRRKAITLYLMDEPDPKKSQTVDLKTVEVFSVVYPDGPRDCEAVAVDPERREILLVTKSFLPSVGVYTIPLPPRSNGKLAVRHEAVAKRIATLAIPMITAMDVNQQNGDVVITGYFQAFHYRCKNRDDPFSDQLGSLPKPIELPRWRQVEALTIDSSQQIWLTSEGSPMPMGRIPYEFAE
ncbi:MAG: hypothetical protein AAGG48_05255 [Planctomycetota bacterium]